MPALLLLATLVAAEPAALPLVDMPKVVDDRLTLELVCQEPNLVTPTGLTIDDQGRLLVIENHTHQRPADYRGPPHDRILLIDPRESPPEPFIWYEGTKNTMNIARAPDDSIYVATRSEIFRLRDTDGDDRADERTEIVVMETAGNYPHNGLSGFAFRDGYVYFGLGENLGAEYKLFGSDLSLCEGGGEGGNVFACKLDGSELRRVATGFWNPFHVAFDANGNLFAVDNDPDSRPPCRLLHVVEGGDYGFKFRHGRKGTHPFTSWNGELPGTLPMVCGTGEAPCAILACSGTRYPEDWNGDLLVTSWGDHRIERYELTPRGQSYVGQMQTVIIGGENFRPVGLAAAVDGTFYFTDWVDKSYPVHGKGRIWRLSFKKWMMPIVETKIDCLLTGTPPSADEARRLEQVFWKDLGQKGEADPFVWQKAAQSLAKILRGDAVLDADTIPGFFHDFVTPGSSAATIWAAVAARDADIDNAIALVPYLLKHAEPRVRLLGVIWAGDLALVDRRGDVEAVLQTPDLTRELFAAVLAALEVFDMAGDKAAKPYEFYKRNNAGDTYVLKVLNDAQSPPAVRRFALKSLPPDHPELKLRLLEQLVGGDDPAMRIEAIRTLRERTGPERDAVLQLVADDAARNAGERLEAAIGLGRDMADRVAPNDAPPAAERIAALADGGDAMNGERLFFHPRVASCYRCHEHNGRGAAIGPDLTTFGRGANRERILQSLLDPSREIAPLYVPWIIETVDGRVRTGLYVGEEVKGEHRYADAEGKIFLVHPNDIERREAAKQSIMPADFGKTLTDDELRDLAAFLLRP